MKRNRLFMMLVLSIVAVVSMIPIGCAPETAEQESDASGTAWRWYSNHIGDDSAACSEATIADIEEQTNGRIKIDFYPAGQLGDWIEGVGHIMRGTIDAGLVCVAMTYDPRCECLYLPCAVKTYDEAAAAWGPGGWLFDLASELLAEQNIKYLGTFAMGFGGFALADIPDFDPMDPDSNKKGTKVRVCPGVTAHEAYIARYGYLPTSIPWSDLYTALQTGVVDGQMGSTAEVAWEQQHDVLHCWVQNNYWFEFESFQMNLDLWNSLSSDDQEVIQDICAKNGQASFDVAEAAQELYFEKMRAAGWRVVLPTTEQLATQATITHEEIWPQMEARVGTILMDQVRELVG